jgi:large subunit ribosomal protein L9
MWTAEKVQVKLLKRIAGIGKEWEIVSVSHSQAKNYLIPKGFAVQADPKLIEQEALKKKKQEANRLHNVENSQKIAELLHLKEIHFTLRGKGDKVFGWIAEHDIVKKIQETFHISLEKKNILLPDGHIKKTGVIDIKIHISDDVYIRMPVHVAVSE